MPGFFKVTDVVINFCPFKNLILGSFKKERVVLLWTSVLPQNYHVFGPKFYIFYFLLISVRARILSSVGVRTWTRTRTRHLVILKLFVSIWLLGHVSYVGCGVGHGPRLVAGTVRPEGRFREGVYNLSIHF